MKPSMTCERAVARSGEAPRQSEVLGLLIASFPKTYADLLTSLINCSGEIRSILPYTQPGQFAVAESRLLASADAQSHSCRCPGRAALSFLAASQSALWHLR